MPEVEEIKTDEHSERHEKTSKKSKNFLNKIVIRKLPPNLSEEQFLEQIAPLPDISDFYFCKPDWTLGGAATSRAYLEFVNEDDIFIFRDKFDGYVFVDSVRGSEYPAIVEYAPFQGLPKSRSRKTDKHMGTIETQQHFLDFLESLKNESEENQKSDLPKLEYSYKIKDEQKITTTPLLDFLHAKQQEKRDAKKKKIDEKRRQRDEEKQKRKEKIAQKVPEPIKESKEEVNYGDGVSVRVVPSRTGRNDKKKEKEKKIEPKVETDKEKERKAAKKEKDLERDARRKLEREKQKLKREEKQREKQETEPTPVGKNETKRYSALRKARNEEKQVETEQIEDPKPSTSTEKSEKTKAEERAKKKEDDDRARRQIRNKDRPALQIYQPKRRPDDGTKSENLSKSSDEHSEVNRKKFDGDKRDKRKQRRNSRDENKKKRDAKLKESTVEEVTENIEKIQLDEKIE